MTPWWTQHWADTWGIVAFHTVFWPLLVLGLPMGRARFAGNTPRPGLGRATVSLGAGVALGAALLGASLCACLAAQPAYVWQQLAIWGGLFAVIDGVLLGTVIRQRTRPRHAELKGGGA